MKTKSLSYTYHRSCVIFLFALLVPVSTWSRNKNIPRAFARKRPILRVAAHPVCVATHRVCVATHRSFSRETKQGCESGNWPISTASLSFSLLYFPFVLSRGVSRIALTTFVFRSTLARSMPGYVRTYA
jgi:hypothetical protein